MTATAEPRAAAVELDVIHLSPPDMSTAEREALLRAFDSGWVAPAGPELDAFEAELAAYVGAEAWVALSSGTAALHLALLGVGVRPGDRVVVQTATFAASAFAVTYAGAEPVFCDVARSTWNIDPERLEAWLDSPSHRAVLLKPRARWAGIGVRVDAEGRTIGVLNFGDAT